MATVNDFSTEELASVPTLNNGQISPSLDLHVLDVLDEKAVHSSSDEAVSSTKGNVYVDSEKSSQLGTDDSDVVFRNGEPVVTTGKDVSRFVVDLRDDGDQGLTFRSMILGTVFAGLGAALCQIYVFKPLQMSVSTVFLLLLIYTFGNAWAIFLPRKSWVAGTRFEFFGPFFDFINPGAFKIKEHVIASLLASTAAGGSTAVQNFAVQRLYYNTDVGATTAILATFSTACFGYGIVGVLRPLAVYPSEMVYWSNLPDVSVFQALHYNTSANIKRVKLFWAAFTGMFFYEIIPAYIFPYLNGFNIFCLASQHASPNTQNIFTNLFGGTDANEGLGLLSLSFDWQYIGSAYMSLPLFQQANAWVGVFLCYFIVVAIYYTNTWNSLSFPMLSTSIFSSNGSIYDQAAVFGSTFQVNQTALQEIGLPALTGANAWSNLTANLAIGAVIAHSFLFWGGYAKESYKVARSKTQPDPHYQAMKKYKEVPWWWYVTLLVISFFAGLIVVLKGQTTLPWWSYIIALILGGCITPFSTLLYARTGGVVYTTQLMKMVAGVINPGKPVANLYFSMWSHDVVVTSITLASDLKMGQYLKIPPRIMFLTQIWGTILGAIVNYIVMISIVDAKRDILLDPIGTNVWSGQVTQSENSAAVTWSLAKELYGRSGPYFIIPMSLLIGMVPTIIQWLIWRRWPKFGSFEVDSILLPVIYEYASLLTGGVNSTVLSGILTGIVSQFWIRKRYPRWYKKYNYILGGALDGGAQVMVFILAFAVFGASGKAKPFPSWAGNPAKGNIDYCNGNGALDSDFF